MNKATLIAACALAALSNSAIAAEWWSVDDSKCSSARVPGEPYSPGDLMDQAMAAGLDARVEISDKDGVVISLESGNQTREVWYFRSQAACEKALPVFREIMKHDDLH